MLPLYEDNQAPEEKPGDANVGLWYDKFCNQWCQDPKKHGLEAWSLEAFEIKRPDDRGKEVRETVNPKMNWIDTVATENGTCGDTAQLNEARRRIGMLLESQGQRPLYYTLESDFVTGLGREHPVENGFAWHHTLGTPYLPGSSVKGMVRAWAEHWEKADKAELRRIFGSERKADRDFQVGSVVFLDALPTQPVTLKADIMTPHYSLYYQDPTRYIPADWHSPIPIPFLVVEAEASFMFGILPRRKEDGSDCEVAQGWLEEALKWTGAGAKTAVGYGRFAVDTEAKQTFEQELEERSARQRDREAEEQRRQEIVAITAGKSGLYKEIYEASVKENWRENREAFIREGVIENWLERLESDPQPDATGYLRAFVELHLKGLLQNPEAKRGRKQKPAYSDRQRNFARRMLQLLERTRRETTGQE